jgi:spermidine synthase
MLLKNYRRITGQKESAPLRFGLIGMGAGTVAVYGQPGDSMRFYEIDPQILELSEGSRPVFTYVHDSRGKIETVLGDARLSMEAEASRNEFQQFDVLVLDAFSGDAIPVHLLTSEAMQLYLRHLRGADSVIAVHIANRAVDLTPVLRAVSAKYDLTFNDMGGFTGPEWVLLCKNPKILRDPMLYRPFKWSDAPVLWTDDYSNLLTVLKK